MVEPIDPFQRGELDLFEISPGPVPADDLGLVETVDRLGQGVVVRVSDAANRALDAGLSQPLGVANSKVLNATVAVVNGKRSANP